MSRINHKVTASDLLIFILTTSLIMTLGIGIVKDQKEVEKNKLTKAKYESDIKLEADKKSSETDANAGEKLNKGQEAQAAASEAPKRTAASAKKSTSTVKITSGSVSNNAADKSSGITVPASQTTSEAEAKPNAEPSAEPAAEPSTQPASEPAADSVEQQAQ